MTVHLTSTLRVAWGVALLWVLGGATGARAQASTASDDAARCTRRMAHLLGLRIYDPRDSARDGLAPQAKVRDWLRTNQAITMFARFTNSRFNPEIATNSAGDAVYAATRFVLSTGRPWRELFTGRYVINHTNNNITENAQAPALGYFGSVGWQQRYLGNAPDGLMLRAAYRVLHNTIGVRMTPSAVNSDGDATATGRQAPECRGCHFDGAYALDPLAQLLPRKEGFGMAARVKHVPVTPQTVLGGLQVNDFEHLVQTLTSSEAFAFNSCRLAFEFVFGRRESACEAPLFDRCVEAFQRTGMMQDALATYLEDPAYCEGVP